MAVHSTYWSGWYSGRIGLPLQAARRRAGRRRSARARHGRSGARLGVRLGELFDREPGRDGQAARVAGHRRLVADDRDLHREA